jgi:hypothetical protein
VVREGGEVRGDSGKAANYILLDILLEVGLKLQWPNNAFPNLAGKIDKRQPISKLEIAVSKIPRFLKRLEKDIK